jgi:thiamine phosphate synthase YjbQ (UPF0047 family)
MKSFRKELWFETRQRRELINITTAIKDCLRESGIREERHAHHGQCLHQ